MTPDELVKVLDRLQDAGRLRASDLGARKAMGGVKARGHRIAGSESTFRVSGPRAGVVARSVAVRIGTAATDVLMEALR